MKLRNLFSVRAAAFALLAAAAGAAQAQFVWPKESYHNTDPSVYKEDPFITEYRERFFAVFRGDFKTFNKAYDEIKAMVKKNPKDARALVWKGNGDTIEAGILKLKGKTADAKALLELARTEMENAVAMEPNEPKIYMMQAATLYIQGQYFPTDWIPKKAWQDLNADCDKVIHKFSPQEFAKLSIHVRGEVYGEKGVALFRLGKIKEAREAFQEVIKTDPSSDYATKAKLELAAMAAGKPLLMSPNPPFSQ